MDQGGHQDGDGLRQERVDTFALSPPPSASPSRDTLSSNRNAAVLVDFRQSRRSSSLNPVQGGKLLLPLSFRSPWAFGVHRPRFSSFVRSLSASLRLHFSPLLLSLVLQDRPASSRSTRPHALRPSSGTNAQTPKTSTTTRHHLKGVKRTPYFSFFSRVCERIPLPLLLLCFLHSSHPSPLHRIFSLLFPAFSYSYPFLLLVMNSTPTKALVCSLGHLLVPPSFFLSVATLLVLEKTQKGDETTTTPIQSTYNLLHPPSPHLLPFSSSVTILMSFSLSLSHTSFVVGVLQSCSIAGCLGKSGRVHGESGYTKTKTARRETLKDVEIYKKSLKPKKTWDQDRLRGKPEKKEETGECEVQRRANSRRALRVRTSWTAVITTSCKVRRKKASQGRCQWLGQSSDLRDLEDGPSLLEQAARVVLRQSKRSRKTNFKGQDDSRRWTAVVMCA